MSEKNELTAAERLAWKVTTFGHDAELELDELAAFFAVSDRTAQRIGAGIPSAAFTPGVRRWRYGTVVDYAKRREQAA